MKSNFLLRFIIPLVAIIIMVSYNMMLGILLFLIYAVYMIYSRIGYIYAVIGRIIYGKGDIESALKWFNKSYRSGKATPNAIVSYAYLLIKSGETEEPEEILDKLLGRKLNLAEEMGAKSNLALIQWKKGELDKAIDTLTEVYEKYRNTTVYETLGYFLIAKGDLNKALEFNTEAYEYNGTDNVIMDNLGQNLYLMEDYEKSAEIYEKLIQKSPAFPEPYYYYGNVLSIKNDNEKALEIMKKALNYKFSGLSTIKKEDVENKIKYLESKTQGREGV